MGQVFRNNIHFKAEEPVRTMRALHRNSFRRPKPG